MFKIEKLSKSFGNSSNRQQVLQSLSFEIKAKCFTAISGPSGSGKSTLLSILSGLEKADSGDINYNQLDILSLPPSEMAQLRNNDFGFIFQTPFFIPYKTVLENILLPSQYYDINKELNQEQIQKQFENRSIELAHSVGLQDHMNKNPAILSGGELQRMAFARALMMQPKVVFADEPTASLDIENSENLLSMLQVQVQRGTTVIMVSHDQQALSWADKLLMLKEKGKQIVQV
mgnify:CR=1 FL=1